ncbi:MAG: pyruvate kinase [Deltaproteobacteria bacterium CG11_big_fil_rev_8_21_14_0_20_49_13]|nr:MAG: pyruvate kinase [Deltaproteobacteria bacterium CG11_big_fil_rev_8_21_14_0_20_49_13]
MSKKTKVIATIGPKSSDLKTLKKMVESGLDVTRINFSHGEKCEYLAGIKTIRDVERITGKHIAILADLSGPKIRTDKIPNPIQIRAGEKVILAPESTASKGDIPITYAGLVGDVKSGDTLLIDDGKLEVKVISKKSGKIIAESRSSGFIGDHKGINLPGIAIKGGALTPKDVENLKFAVRNGVDYIGVSFVQGPEDLVKAKKIMKKAGRILPLVAKIERGVALAHLKEIVKEADAVMVARGDLGVETAIERLPIVQKEIIKMCGKFRRPVIVATQMLESMVTMTRPTRAEVNDVATSVFEGADCLMLSGETAVGHDPVNAVATMTRIIRASELSRYHIHIKYELDPSDDNSVTAVTRAASFAAEEAKAKAIIVFTMTGKSPVYVSKQRPHCDILAVASSIDAARRSALFYGVKTFVIPAWRSIDAMIESGIRMLKKKREIKKGDRVVILCGTVTTPGATNMLKIVTC